MPRFSTRTVKKQYLSNYSGLQLGKGEYRRIPLLHCKQAISSRHCIGVLFVSGSRMYKQVLTYLAVIKPWTWLLHHPYKSCTLPDSSLFKEQALRPPL